MESAEPWSEDRGVVGALHFSVVALTTIGYDDLLPTTTGAKPFTIIYSFVGIDIIAALATSPALSIRNRHEERHGRGPGGTNPAD